MTTVMTWLCVSSIVVGVALLITGHVDACTWVGGVGVAAAAIGFAGEKRR